MFPEDYLNRTGGIPTPGYDNTTDQIKTTDAALGDLIITLTAAIETLTGKLEDIKDTEGIKKITDDVTAIITDSDIAVPVDMQFHDLDAAHALPVNDADLQTLVGEVQESPTPNTLLARMKSLEDKWDAMVDGTGSPLVALSGSIPEYGWLSTDDEPTPDDPTKMALGIVIDVSTDTMSIKYWNGSLWKELM